MTKHTAGWAALITALGLSVEAAAARLHPSTASGTEATIITALLAFAAASFGVSAYEGRKPPPEK